MFKIIGSLTIVFLFLSHVAVAEQKRQDILNFKSQYSVNETEKNLLDILKNKGFTIFEIIDHQAGAKGVGLDLPATKVIIFGNPKIGSKLMQCSPSIAIDLPQKALISKDSNQNVWLTVNNPQYLKNRHQVTGCDAIFSKITAALTAISTKATKK